jgi:hypothetical protein
MFKKRWEITAGDVTVFIDGGRQHGTTMLMIPTWVVGATTKKRNTVWGSTDDHDLPPMR